MRSELATLDDLLELARVIRAKGRAPITQFELVGSKDVAQATMAWVGLTWGRDFELLRILAQGLPQSEPAKGITFAVRVTDGVYEFPNEFDKLKSTLYYELVRRLS